MVFCLENILSNGKKFLGKSLIYGLVPLMISCSSGGGSGGSSGSGGNGGGDGGDDGGSNGNPEKKHRIFPRSFLSNKWYFYRNY